VVSFTVPETVTAPFVVLTARPPSEVVALARRHVAVPHRRLARDIIGTPFLRIGTYAARDSAFDTLLTQAPWAHPAEEYRLGSVTHHIVISARFSPRSQPAHTQAARATARVIASACDGLIYDAATHQILPFATRRLRERRAFFLGDDWLSVFVGDEKGGIVRASTVGLHRFGLPEFDAPDVPAASWAAAVSLLRCFAACTLAEHWEWLVLHPGGTDRELADDVLLESKLIWDYWGVDAPSNGECVRFRVLDGRPYDVPCWPVMRIRPPIEFHGSERLWWEEVVRPSIPFIPRRPLAARAA
jgi:hypothetical protein